MSSQLTPAQLEQRRQAKLKHGAQSEPSVSHISTVEKRAFLRARGLRLRDLDAVGVALLDVWARGMAKVTLMDRYFDANGGYLDENGEPSPASKTYWLAYNSTQRALGRLEEHLRHREPSRLQAWLEGELADEEGR